MCHLLEITQLVCQLIWCVLAMMHGVTTAQTCSTNVSADVACHVGWSDNGVSADVASVHHSAWFSICSGLLKWHVSWWGVYLPWCLVWYLLKIAQLVCQLMWRLLAMMPGVTAWDYSTGVSADLVSAFHGAWCENCWKLLNWCQLMWRLLAIMPGSAKDYSLVCQLMWHLLAMMSGVLTAHDCSFCFPWYLVCQLMWRLLAMMTGVTTAQDYSAGV